jgi:hypothetical protein
MQYMQYRQYKQYKQYNRPRSAAHPQCSHGSKKRRARVLSTTTDDAHFSSLALVRKFTCVRVHVRRKEGAQEQEETDQLSLFASSCRPGHECLFCAHARSRLIIAHLYCQLRAYAVQRRMHHVLALHPPWLLPLPLPLSCTAVLCPRPTRPVQVAATVYVTCYDEYLLLLCNPVSGATPTAPGSDHARIVLTVLLPPCMRPPVRALTTGLCAAVPYHSNLYRMKHCFRSYERCPSDTRATFTSLEGGGGWRHKFWHLFRQILH